MNAVAHRGSSCCAMLISDIGKPRLSHEPTPEQDAPEPCCMRCEVRVRGVVQGVGFRPFVYRLATEEGLAGFIGNNTDGVTIEVEGTETAAHRFLERLTMETPPMARIDSVAVSDGQPTGESDFRIIASEVLGKVS